MDITLFDFELPPTYIAQEPLEKRDESKLMILDRETGLVEHKKFFQIIDYLKPDDLLVLNDSKVLPVRLVGYKKKTGGKVEVLLIKSISDSLWQVLLKPGRRTPAGTEIIFSSQLKGLVTGKDEKEGVYLLEIQVRGNFREILDKIGKIPTPPYIKQELQNPSSYQTIYANQEGSLAAPTAGIHFTRELLAEIKRKGIEIIYLTLHIGRGTFELVKVNQVEKHQMKEEWYSISSENARIINQAILDKRRIVGVGTSVTRTLESAFVKNRVSEGTCWTNLFICPGYQFKVLDALITNFHLPRSSPLLLASAFAGKDFLFKAYQEAICKHYRFYSFGDAMFII
jgi:S-adenosylmethionine:tRNA ribosyltransferase-isomerase